jgi:hypothetical protein
MCQVWRVVFIGFVRHELWHDITVMLLPPGLACRLHPIRLR